MAKKVAFVGFGAVQDTDSQRVADVLGVEKSQQLGFFESINDAAQFVVTKVDGKITAIEGSEVYVSADADDDTISKARRIRSVGVAVNLDWEPFRNASYSDNALRSWVNDGEWLEDSISAPSDSFVVPSYIEEEPVTNPSDYDFPTQPYSENDNNYLAPEETALEIPTEQGNYSSEVPQFEAPSDIAPLPIAPIGAGGYSDAYASPEPTFDAPYAVEDNYAQPEETFVAPEFDAPYEEAPQFEAPVQYEEAPEEYVAPEYLDVAQSQTPAPAPMASFLQVQPIQEEPDYSQAAPQYAAPEEDASAYQQYAAPVEEYQEQPQYEPQVAYEAPVEYTQETPQYAPEPTQQYSAPVEIPTYASPVEEPSQFGGYTPPASAAPFIQHSPTPPPEPTQHQRERSMFEQVPAGMSNDFESRNGGKIVYVTGSHGGAGKTTTAWTLASLVAVSMKKAGNEDISVWLIESDYRNSKLAQRHNIDPDRTSGHLAAMLEWLNDQSGIVDNLPQRKAQAIAQSTHRLENGLNIIACPYDTTKRDTKYIQQAVFQAAQYAKMQGGIVFIDADTISNDDIMDSKLAKAADRVVIVSDAGPEHIDDLKRAARILTTPVVSGGLGVAMPAITVLLNKTGPNEFKQVEDSGILAPLALGGYLPFIPEWATGWVGSLTNTDTFQNAVVLFARFFNGIVPMKELHQWSNYRATGTSKKSGGSWVRRIFMSKKAK